MYSSSHDETDEVWGWKPGSGAGGQSQGGRDQYEGRDQQGGRSYHQDRNQRSDRYHYASPDYRQSQGWERRGGGGGRQDGYPRAKYEQNYHESGMFGDERRGDSNRDADRDERRGLFDGDADKAQSQPLTDPMNIA